MAEAFKLYKLIILYMLDKVDFPLTNSQISEFILNEGYTTYFKLQQALSELLDSGFIREESTHTRTFYHLTEEGEETIITLKMIFHLQSKKILTVFSVINNMN